jgi:DNA end-binding protein Ku
MDALKRSLAAGGRTPAEQAAPAPKKRASAKASQRDQPQLKLPIAGGKSKAAASKESAAKPSRRKAS